MHQDKQYELFQLLARRIGYSVGLEDTFNRVKILVESYVENKNIDLAIWKDIVQNKYNRKISDDLTEKTWGGVRKKTNKLGAEDHIANFFSEINLISKLGNQIFPLFGLEILSILRRSLNDDDFFAALKLIILIFLIESDGDIFLNCLQGKFNKEECRILLGNMFKFKRERYLKVFNTPSAYRNIQNIFAVQSNIAKKESFASIFTTISNDEIEIPDEYLDKVLGTRKNWAIQAGLYENGITDKGESFFKMLQHLRITTLNEFSAFFPYSDLHKKMFIDENKLNIKSLSRFDFWRMMTEWFYDKTTLNYTVEMKTKIYEILYSIIKLYRSANTVKGLIRHQIPLYIVYPCYSIINLARESNLVNFESFLENESRAIDRKISVTSLRGFEGALNIKEL